MAMQKAKNNIHELYNALQKYEARPTELLDISDVLLQIYKRLDEEEHSET